jgi:hypothetical protein
MRRVLSVVIVMLAIALPSHASGQKEETIRFTVGGESPHWVVWLDGSGTKQGNQLTYVQAQPIISWAGGVESPSAYRVTFRIDDRPPGPVNVTVNDRSRHSAIMGAWKLIYPGMPSITATNSVGVVRAIRETGAITLEWNGQKETIQWVYSNPDPRGSGPAQ